MVTLGHCCVCRSASGEIGMRSSGMRQADFRQTFYQEAYLFSALTHYQQDIKHHPNSRGCSFYPSSVSLEVLLKALFLPQRNPKYFLEIAPEFFLQYFYCGSAATWRVKYCCGPVSVKLPSFWPCFPWFLHCEPCFWCWSCASNPN